MSKTSHIQIDIGDCVTGDLSVTGENITINIAGSVEGSVTVRQMPCAGPEEVLVEIDGERVAPEAT